MAEKSIVIFGAGKIGKEALLFYGQKVAFFIDNNADLWGTTVEGIPVKKVEEYIDVADCYRIVIASRYKDEMVEQLEKFGITEYIYFENRFKGYYWTSEVVVNPYAQEVRAKDEKHWNTIVKKEEDIQAINKKVDELSKGKHLFNHVEIETVNRCNGTCDFCPVSKNRDSREYREMTFDGRFKLCTEFIYDSIGDMQWKFGGDKFIS